MRPAPAFLGHALLAASALGAGCGDDGSMVRVASGEFEMGCNTKEDRACDTDERPTHVVTLKSFVIDRREVTWGAYMECARKRKCTDPSGNLDARSETPVTNVSWDQADAYCQVQGKHLPTEAQWEKAARGRDGRIFPWGSAPSDCEHAVTFNCGTAPHSASGATAGRSPYGAINMAGNVREWVADWYGTYSSAPADNPPGPSRGDKKVTRGGSFKYTEVYARTSARSSDVPTTAVGDLGFRCAR